MTANLESADSKTSTSSWRKTLTIPTRDASLVAMDMRDFKVFRELIHRETGIWLRDGKQVMLAARLAKRLRHHDP